MWKSSIFNNIQEINGSTLIWNSRTGALAKLDEQSAHYLQNPDHEAISKEIEELMARNGFIIEKDRNEADEVIKSARTASQNAEGLYYVIAPTLACNYRCIYCFENDRSIYSSMSYTVADDVISFIDSAIKKRQTTKYLHINWFGGEPLLKIDILEYISLALIELCNKYSIQYRASIVTNGRYLDKGTAALLQTLHVGRIQISIDGTQEIYCERKKATEQDYRITLENITAAAKILHGIIVRINTSHGDFADANKLTNLLLKDCQLDGKIKIYCANTYEGTQENRIKEYPFFCSGEEAFRAQFGRDYLKQSYSVPRSKARRMTCGLFCHDRFCIGPEGELYKCEHDFGQKESIVGSIYGQRFLERLNAYNLADYNTLEREECRECSVLPICLGGCPNHTRKNEIPFDCTAYRNYLLNLAIGFY